MIVSLADSQRDRLADALIARIERWRGWPAHLRARTRAVHRDAPRRTLSRLREHPGDISDGLRRDLLSFARAELERGIAGGHMDRNDAGAWKRLIRRLEGGVDFKHRARV